MAVAMVVPMNEVGDEFEEDWNGQPRFTAMVPANPAAGRNQPLRFDDATDDRTVVALARRYEEIAKRGSSESVRFWRTE
jgi:hypothetical protein